MTDKEYYIDFWTPTLGAEEAARSWEVKQSQVRVQAPMVMGDIQPFRSVVDGSVINSRKDHREHMKKHGLIEIGNEPIRKQEYRGDHNVRPELTQAVKQVLRK